jgi:hypothetical protein
MEEIKSKNKIEISIKKQIRVEKELVGNITPHPNHKLFEIDNETGEINEAMYIEEPTFIKFGMSVPKNIIKKALVRDGYTYVSAMNKKNALKHYRNNSNGGKKLGDGLNIKIFE